MYRRITFIHSIQFLPSLFSFQKNPNTGIKRKVITSKPTSHSVTSASATTPPTIPKEHTSRSAFRSNQNDAVLPTAISKHKPNLFGHNRPLPPIRGT